MAPEAVTGPRAASAEALTARIDIVVARVYLGDAGRASTELALLEGPVRRAGATWEAAYLAYARGTLATRQHRPAVGAASFDEAARGFRHIGDRCAHAYTLTRLSDLAIALGRPDLARAHRRTALGLFHGAGDRFGMLAALQPPPVDAAAPATAGSANDGLGALTRREREVAELVGTGLTNRQIGERIMIAERTVDTHVQRILAKLHCASRVQVAVLVAGGRP